MNNETNVNYVTTETAVAIDTNVKVLKRQPGLGKLNRLTKAAQNKLFANGHSANRFKRDYNAGTATYTCADCKLGAIASVSQARGQSSVSGDALTTACNVVRAAE